MFLDGTNFNELMEKESAMAIVKVKDILRYGEVVFEEGRLKGIREKSGYGEGFVNAGGISPSILNFAERTPASARGEYEVTDSIRMPNHSHQVSSLINRYAIK